MDWSPQIAAFATAMIPLKALNRQFGYAVIVVMGFGSEHLDFYGTPSHYRAIIPIPVVIPMPCDHVRMFLVNYRLWLAA